MELKRKSRGINKTGNHSRSPNYLLAAARIIWELVAVDLPPFFLPLWSKNGVRAYKKRLQLTCRRKYKHETVTCYQTKKDMFVLHP